MVVGKGMRTESELKGKDVKPFTELTTALGHNFIVTQLASSNAFEEVSKTLCEYDKKLLMNSLRFISNDLDGSLDKDGLTQRGVTYRKAGSVAYIINCSPVNVTTRELGHCTQEIPVFYNEEPLFVDPITRVIQDNYTHVPCSAVAPIMWDINDVWICSTPKRAPCNAPRLLKPMTHNFNSTADMQTLGKGLYSKEQLISYNKFMDSVSSGRQVVSGMTDSYSSGDSQLFNISPLLASSVGELTKSLMQRIWGFLSAGEGILLHILTGLSVWTIFWYVAKNLITTASILTVEGCNIAKIIMTWVSPVLYLFTLPMMKAWHQKRKQKNIDVDIDIEAGQEMAQLPSAPVEAQYQAASKHQAATSPTYPGLAAFLEK